MVSSQIPVSEVNLGAGILAFFTSRLGGVSQGAFESLNLGARVGDDPVAVHANRQRVEQRLGMPVRYLNQVHGNAVHVVEASATAPSNATDGLVEKPTENPTEEIAADGAISLGEHTGLGVYVADCVPVLLADSTLGQIAVAHAGRPGLVLDVIGETVRAMVAQGSAVENIRAAVGPCICPNCYEVPAGMAREFELVTGAEPSQTRWGTASVDLRRAAQLALERAGVSHVAHVAECTYESDAYFSHRWATHNTEATAGRSGRFAGIIGRINTEVPGEICR